MAVSLSMPILIVDDYNTMIRILRNLLRQLGFSNIDEASDGRTALTKLRAKEYALVISDWNMEPMTGMELLQRVRADDRTKATPFVMVANDAGDDGAAADRAGASTYIVKPFTAQTLKTKLVSGTGRVLGLRPRGLADRPKLAVAAPLRPRRTVGDAAAHFIQKLQIAHRACHVPAPGKFIARLVIARSRRKRPKARDRVPRRPDRDRSQRW